MYTPGACVTARHRPRNTCCRHKPTPPLHDYKRASNRPSHTPEHKSTWNYTYTNTLIPILALPAASQSYKPILYWIGTAKTMVPKKAQKCGNLESPCLDKPVSGQGGGGGRYTHTHELPAASSSLYHSFRCRPSTALWWHSAPLSLLACMPRTHPKIRTTACYQGRSGVWRK